jgi:hypothetical protein
MGIEELAGVTAIEVSTASVTVTGVMPVTLGTPGRVAVMVTLPAPVPVTWPPLLTVAIASDDEVQLT